MSNQINIVKGIGGSHAHGLAHADSDRDYRGVHSFPTDSWWRLNKPADTIVTSAPDPDSSTHELEKFLSLASKGNPDVLEVLALDTYIDFEPRWGNKLLDLTPSLLSNVHIKNAYMGYANQQFKALKARAEQGNESFSAGMGSRTWKHAKHMFRLLETGHRILETGELSIKVKDRDWYLKTLPQLSLQEMILVFEKRFLEVENTPGVLPETNPDLEAINRYIYDYRKAH